MNSGNNFGSKFKKSFGTIAKAFRRSIYTISWANLSAKCKEKNICVVDCSEIVPECKKLAYFSDFTEKAQGTADEVFKAYMDACIHKKFDDPKTPNPIKSYLMVKMGLFVNFGLFGFKIGRPTQLTYAQVLEKIEKSNDSILKYLGKMSELMFIFRKMCTEDSDWKDKVEEKVTKLFDDDVSDIQGQFKGNPKLKEHFVSQIQQLKALRTQMVLSNIFSDGKLYQKFTNAKTSFQNFFIGLIKAGKLGHVCQCANFMKNNNLFPNGQQIAEERCKSVCGSSNNVLEEIIYEE